MKWWHRCSISAAAAWGAVAAAVGYGANAPTTAPATQPALRLSIDLDKSQNVTLPAPAAKDELKPAAFHTADGRSGWIVHIPGGHPIAMPAYADGLLFVGGGYGSNDFYAFDAATGTMKWKLACDDDGPTSAVVSDGMVAFNTESCSLIVCEAKTGKILWEQWLGDPLMSQPAVADGKLYMAYPGAHPHGIQQGPATAPSNLTVAAAPDKPVGPANQQGYRLLCADLKTGKHLWEQDITADVITAPVIDGNAVLLTCMDGNMFCLSTKDGSINWHKQASATSAPILVNGQVIDSQRRGEGDNIREGLVRMSAADGSVKDKELVASTQARYFKPGNSGNVPIVAGIQNALDKDVGNSFEGVTNNIGASNNANITSVAGGWAYQGSRAAANGTRVVNAQANVINYVESKTGQVLWQATAKGKDIDSNSEAFSPPALGSKNLYICSGTGHFICIAQGSGKPIFSYHFPVQIAFQPCLAKGNMYAGTVDGRLICLSTNIPDADGWYAWGGNAAHDKK